MALNYSNDIAIERKKHQHHIDHQFYHHIRQLHCLLIGCIYIVFLSRHSCKSRNKKTTLNFCCAFYSLFIQIVFFVANYACATSFVRSTAQRFRGNLTEEKRALFWVRKKNKTKALHQIYRSKLKDLYYGGIRKLSAFLYWNIDKRITVRQV